MLKSQEADLLNSLQISRHELYAFAELVNRSHEGDINNSLLDVLGEKTKESLYVAVATHFREEKCKTELIREQFPELTQSELVICSYILQDMTVGQISEKLNRTSGNITSQRSKIRAKLGLGKDDNLKEALKIRMQAFQTELAPKHSRRFVFHRNHSFR